MPDWPFELIQLWMETFLELAETVEVSSAVLVETTTVKLSVGLALAPPGSRGNRLAKVAAVPAQLRRNRMGVI